MERLTTADGIELAVQASGNPDGPTVVLVHGFPDDHSAWDGVVDRLAADHRVVTYDTRGTGSSSRPRRIADYRLDELAADLQAVIDHVDTGDGVHLVGHDWGSVQGWHLVTGEGARGVRSYTSISGGCVDHIPGWVARQAKARRFRAIAAMWKSPLYMGLFSIPLLAPLLARLGVFDPTIRLALNVFERPEQGEGTRPGPSARRNAPSIRIYAANVFPRLLRPDGRGGTDVPVQVLTPLCDIFVPAVTQGDPHPEVRTVEIREVPGGHWAPTYNPGAVAGPIRDWIARHPG
ncbi:alpha/beta fold hydrolase [Nocardioides jejuensis]|uniref:Alpha/beta fold hydrolase n=1 Tax=Nocardioides jejuensis TaxID=2502782 RepID=A0A4R1CHP9_9ACTN|nr:alpha/beta fold hydrolase [Nocardioides jejuensis]TCJ29458.1 alpha/beta fold hydrolase [Nocardioides jejuensis]